MNNKKKRERKNNSYDYIKKFIVESGLHKRMKLHEIRREIHQWEMIEFPPTKETNTRIMILSKIEEWKNDEE